MIEVEELEIDLSCHSLVTLTVDLHSIVHKEKSA